MSEPVASPTESLSKDEMMTYLFAQMVMQQSNLAMMMLGRTAHPETGKPVRDLEAARLFIDQLEMLEAKTKGNLTKEEAGLLKQNLMSLRLAFVESVGQGGDSTAPAAAEPAKPEPRPVETAPPPAEESHKKFSKKY